MRRAAVTVSIKGHDVTLDLMPYLVSLTYTDKADEELDDLQIVLEDREGIWQGDWLPQTGDVIEASILTENWREIGAVEELPCGKFEVDEMELESSAEGGDTVTVKAVPAAVKSSLMLQKKTRSWEKTPITTVIADIAGAAGLDTLYRGPELVYERVEQRQESDLEFMQRITKEQGLRLAVKSDRVVVYAGQTADQLEPIGLPVLPGEADDRGHLHAMRRRLHESGGFRDDRDAVRAEYPADDRARALHQQADRESGAGRAHGEGGAARQEPQGTDRLAVRHGGYPVPGGHRAGHSGMGPLRLEVRDRPGDAHVFG